VQPQTTLTLSELATHLRCGDLKAEAHANYVVSRAAALGSLHAFTCFDSEQFVEKARAADLRRAQGLPLPPLHGVPIVVKDNIDVFGFATTAGTPSLANCRPKKTAPVVQSLIEQGAIIPAKTNMHEIAMGATSSNAMFGATRNPYALGRIPGGSSGGSAAAVGARIVCGAVGTDTIGSIRIPASLCGCGGFRPSIGRYSQEGMVPLSTTRDTAGPLALSVGDLQLLDSIMASKSAPDQSRAEQSLKGLSGLRLGVLRSYFYRNLDSEVENATEEALRVLADCGAVLVDVELPQLYQFESNGSFAIIFHEVRHGLERYLRDSDCGVSLDSLVAQLSSPDVRQLVQNWHGENAIPEEVYRLEVDVKRPALQSAFWNLFVTEGIEALIFPTVTQPATALNSDGALQDHRGCEISQLAYLQNTDPGSYCGLPGVTIPSGITSQGLPIGLGFDGPHGTDTRLLRIAEQVEFVMPKLAAPPICA
jgi:mandelamide amidase